MWKDVKDFEGLYQVNDKGEVRRIHKDGTYYTLVGGKKCCGYTSNELSIVCLSKENKNYMRYRHRLVAEAFIPNPDNLPMLRFKDGDRYNMDASNLEWVNHNKLCKPVIQLHCGNIIETYNSIREASRATGGATSNICDVCKGRRRQANGFEWRYAEV